MPEAGRVRRRLQPARPAPPVWWAALRHPLMLLLAGTLLSSLIIPWINGRSARVERRQTGRQQKAVEVLRAAGQDTRRLNALLLVLENYERVGTATSEEANARRADLQSRAYDIYGEFAGDAWWWYQGALRESDVFEWLDATEQARFQALAARYKANLLEVAKVIDVPWQQYLSEKRSGAGGKPLMPAVAEKLGKLQTQRDELAAEMVRVFR